MWKKKGYFGIRGVKKIRGGRGEVPQVHRGFDNYGKKNRNSEVQKGGWQGGEVALKWS